MSQWGHSLTQEDIHQKSNACAAASCTWRAEPPAQEWEWWRSLGLAIENPSINGCVAGSLRWFGMSGNLGCWRCFENSKGKLQGQSTTDVGHFGHVCNHKLGHTHSPKFRKRTQGTGTKTGIATAKLHLVMIGTEPSSVGDQRSWTIRTKPKTSKNRMVGAVERGNLCRPLILMVYPWVLSSSQKFAAIVTEIYQVDNSESGIKPLISTDESDLAIKAAREDPSKPPFTGDIPPIEKMSRAARDFLPQRGAPAFTMSWMFSLSNRRCIMGGIHLLDPWVWTGLQFHCISWLKKPWWLGGLYPKLLEL